MSNPFHGILIGLGIFAVLLVVIAVLARILIKR